MNHRETPVAHSTAPQIMGGENSWLKTLTRFSVDVIGYDDELSLAWYVAREIVASLGFNDCVVYYIDQERQVLRQVAAIGEKKPDEWTIVNRLEIPVGVGVTGHVAQHLMPERIDDVANDPRYIQDLVPARSEICVPLIVDGTAYGVIDCEEPYTDAFNADHQALLESVAAMMSAKLELLSKTRALAESERNHRDILENIIETFYRTDAEGRVVKLSASGAGLYGAPIEELIGRPYAELHSDPADYDRFLTRLIENGDRLSRYEVKMRRCDGTEFWAANSARVYRDEAGRFLVVEGITRNITEQRYYQSDLKEAQAQLIKAQRIAGLGF